ncbi:MAG: beta-lactamase family protein [Gemmatimonadetes bacterium]|nr:beta-lactamase family protein [Gemmatimonadota bacterium]
MGRMTGTTQKLGLLALLVGLCPETSAAASAAASADGESTSAADELTAYVQKTMALLHPSSAAIVVSVGQQIVFERYLPGSFEGLPETVVDENSLWALASATKSYGAAILLMLVHEGVVGLDDPVSEYLPLFEQPGDGPFARTAVTLRHLASHTSGLGHRARTQDTPPDSAIVLTEPGVDFQYSWLGVHMLERAIEAATGEDYERLLHRKLLEPMALQATRFVYEPDPDLQLMPCIAGDYEDPARHYAWSHIGGRISSGLLATARDVNHFGQLWAFEGTLRGHTYFTPELARQAWTHHGTRAFDNGAYGLLWWLFPEEEGYVMSGATHTVSAVVPADHAVVTVMRNYIAAPAPEFSFYEDKLALVRFAKQFARE